MAVKKANGAAKKTYILELKGGDTRKITIPAHWRLTYGNVLPYQGKDARHQMEHRIALRVYDGSKDNLRAVYTDVVAFRDADIGTLEKRVKVQRRNIQRATPHGAKDFAIEARMTQWVDPDNESNEEDVPGEFLHLPPGAED